MSSPWRESAASELIGRRSLAAAQRCYEEHKALTYPRTSSRYLTRDMVGEIKPKEAPKAASATTGATSHAHH